MGILPRNWIGGLPAAAWTPFFVNGFVAVPLIGSGRLLVPAAKRSCESCSMPSASEKILGEPDNRASPHIA